MAFIGESRQDVCGPWDMYVCLNGGECKSMLPVVDKMVEKARKRYEHFRDVMDGGEATTRQQTLYMEAEEDYENLQHIRDMMHKYIGSRNC